MKRFRLAGLLLLFAATRALAADGSGVYVVARGGLFEPRHSDLDGFHSTVGFDVGIGERVTPAMGWELSTGVASFGTGTLSTGSVSADGSLRIVPVCMVAQLHAPVGMADLYVLAGPAMYYVRLSGRFSDGVSSAHVVDDTITVGGQAGAGISLEVTGRARLVLEGRYHLARAKLFDDRVTGRLDTIQLGGGVAVGF